MRECGLIGQSREAAGLSAHRLRRIRKNEPKFSAQEEEAKLTYLEKCEKKVDQRAFRGVKEAVYYEGDVVGSRTRYSDTLAMFRLKAMAPEKYAERVKQETTLSGQIIVHIPDNGRRPAKSS